MPLSGSGKRLGSWCSEAARCVALKGMLSAMLGPINGLQIGKRVVAPVAIAVMDVHALRYRAVSIAPDTAVKQPLGVSFPV